MRRAHGALAAFLAVFLLLHLGNHLAGLDGQASHRAVQEAFRTVYRHPLVEPLVLLAVAVQIGLGLALFARHRRLTVQTASGLYLALFLLIHLGAVLVARAQGTDTDLAFAAAGLHALAPWPAVFAAYYGFAVMAVFAHLSVPLSRGSPILGRSMLACGATLAVTLVALLAGHVTPLTIPSALIAAFP